VTVDGLRSKHQLLGIIGLKFDGIYILIIVSINPLWSIIDVG